MPWPWSEGVKSIVTGIRADKLAWEIAKFMPQFAQMRKERRRYKETRQEICKQDQIISAFSSSRISIMEKEQL